MTRATIVSVSRPRTPLSTSAGRLVARSPHGLDQLRRRGIRLDLRPQPLDRDVDQARVAEIVVAPDPVEQDVAGQDLAGVPDELEQQVELGPGERDLRAVAKHAAASDVDRECTEAQGGDVVTAAGPPERGPDPGDQLRQVEGLADVVVGAGL